MEPLKILDMLLSLQVKVEQLNQCIKILDHYHKAGTMNEDQIKVFKECKRKFNGF